MLSALVVPVPRVAQIIDGWREKTCNARPSIGVPAHVTLLFPFMPAEQIDYQVLDDLKHLFAGFEPFGFTLPRLARFPTTLYLAPEPAGPFVELTRAIAGRWPDHPPYEGAFDEIVPHLTVAQGSRLDEAEADVAQRLPLRGRAREALLLRQTASERWEPVAGFPFREP